MSNPVLFDLVIQEYKKHYLQKKKVYESSLLGEVKKVKDALLDEKYKPSVQLKNILNKQIKRAVYPMEVAIVGQFSSGKSTFLNALLSKDILPTGITPVTSKVIYINYGVEHKLRVTYRSGVHEYRPIEDIALFSDQRVQNMDDIKYLSVYAPVELLKEMSFVDTPGLNSQSQEDTQSTKKVFQDVGGIIWLTLMDNAGKRSEQEILDTYMSSFKTKSLCLLNQKDKFNEVQIATTTAYIEDKFSNYFSKVIPISAKFALEARSVEARVQIDNAMNDLIKAFRDGLEKHPECSTLKFFSDDFENFKNDVESIKSTDSSEVKEKYKSSNIADVLAYIENDISPNATASKAFRIKNDLKNICDILINSYNTMTAVYDSLHTILESSRKKSMIKFDDINRQYAYDLGSIYHSIEMIFQKVAAEIVEQTSSEIIDDFKTTKGAFFNQDKIEKYAYDSFRIDSNRVMDRLFYNEQSAEEMLKSVMKRLDAFERTVNEDFEEVYSELQNDVLSWQNRYLLLSKNREISSDLEFSKVKRFASKVHENILKTFHASILKNIDDLNKKIAYFRGALSYNFKQTVEVTLSQLEEKILQSEEIYKQDPSKFYVYKPSEEDALERLKINFDLEKIENLLVSQNSYLHSVIKDSKKTFLEISELKMDFIDDHKLPYLEKIDDLKEIKASIIHE